MKAGLYIIAGSKTVQLLLQIGSVILYRPCRATLTAPLPFAIDLQLTTLAITVGFGMGLRSRRPSSNCIVCAALVLWPHHVRSNRACSEKYFKKGSHNDFNQKDPYGSRLVSHFKNPLHVYFSSSDAFCAMARAVDRWDLREDAFGAWIEF